MGHLALVLVDGFSGWLPAQSPVPNLMAWKWAGKGRMALKNLQMGKTDHLHPRDHGLGGYVKRKQSVV